jgi:hypothetical protein
MTREQLEAKRPTIEQALRVARETQTAFWHALSDLETVLGCPGEDVKGISGGYEDLEDVEVDDLIAAAADWVTGDAE